MKKFLPYSLIIIGMLFLISPVISNKILESKQNNITLENMPIDLIKENNNKDVEAFNNADIQDLNMSSIIKGAFIDNSEDLIGVLIIPSIDANLSIFRSLNEPNLMSGVSIINSEQIMGENNYSLAGHYTRNKKWLFGGLMDITEGDEIFISDGEYIYKYIANENIVVPDDAIDMVDINKYDTPKISLMTCYYSSKTGKRYFVIGDFIEKYPITK